VIVDHRIHRSYIGKGLNMRRYGLGGGCAVALLSRIDFGTVNRQSAASRAFARCTALSQWHWPQRSTGNPGHFSGIGAARIIIDRDVVVGHIVVDNGGIIDRIVHNGRVVDDGGVVDNGHILLFADIVVVDMRAGHILLGNEAPVMSGGVIAATGGHADADAGTKRRPAIIVGALPPADPGRRPFISRDPHPAITVFKEPAAIVEGGPSPGIIRSPGPAAVSIHPVAVGGIGFEIGSDIGHPHVAVLRIIDPLAIGAQGVVKRLIGYFGGGRRWRGRRLRGCFYHDMGGATGIQEKGGKGNPCINNKFTHTTIFRRFLDSSRFLSLICYSSIIRANYHSS